MMSQHIFLSEQVKKILALFRVLYLNRTGRMKFFIYVEGGFIRMSHRLWFNYSNNGYLLIETQIETVLFSSISLLSKLPPEGGIQMIKWYFLCD